MKFGLALAFLLTAAFYASAGFGGGSTYTALLAVSGTPFYVIPVVSLLCNICVVTGNCFRYFRAKLLNLSEVWPLFILSIPAAFLGGRLNVSEVVFIGLLCFALFIGGSRLLIGPVDTNENIGTLKNNPLGCAVIGGAIGFYSGVVGIGGGIFLAPILYKMRWGSAQQIAAACSIFILVNSMSGLAGQLIKVTQLDIIREVFPYTPLIMAVIMGGTVGNIISIKFLKPSYIRRITGVLILVVAIRLSFKWMGLMTF